MGKSMFYIGNVDEGAGAALAGPVVFTAGRPCSGTSLAIGRSGGVG